MKLTKTEKRRVKLLWRYGWSIREMTDDVLEGRKASEFKDLLMEIEKYVHKNDN